MILAAAGALSGCAPGKPPFLLAQVCLGSAAEVTAFKQEVQSIARTERMTHVDNSGPTGRDLKAIQADETANIDTERVIDIDISRPDGVGMSAGNLGLPGFQVAVGFSEGLDPGGAREFASRVINRLKNRWRVEIVPNGRGAFGMRDCF